MKKFILPLFAFALFYASCSNENATKDQDQEQAKLIEQVLVKNQLQASEICEMTDAINAISACLDSISVQEKALFVDADESTTKEQILQRLNKFQELLSRKQGEINSLKKQKDTNSATILNLQKLVDYMSAQIDDKNEKILKLHQTIEDKDFKISSLRYDVNQLTNENDYLKDQNYEQDKQLNEVFYVIAEKKELKNMGLLKGTFKKKADYANINKDQFTKKDRRGLTEIKIDSKSPKLITEKPANSYTIVNNEDGTSTLTITDANLFWSVSVFLIIQK